MLSNSQHWVCSQENLNMATYSKRNWKHDGDCVNSGLCLPPQAFPTKETISPKVCVIRQLLTEGDLYSAHPPTHQRYITTHLQGCNIHVDRGSSGRVGWDTYRHHQLEGVLIHPHGWLVLLHHCRDYSDTTNLDNSEKRKKITFYFNFFFCIKNVKIGQKKAELCRCASHSFLASRKYPCCTIKWQHYSFIWPY